MSTVLVELAGTTATYDSTRNSWRARGNIELEADLNGHVEDIAIMGGLSPSDGDPAAWWGRYAVEELGAKLVAYVPDPAGQDDIGRIY